MQNNLPLGAVYAMRLYAVPEMRDNNHASTSCHLGLLPLPCDKEVPPLSDAKKDYALLCQIKSTDQFRLCSFISRFRSCLE